MPKNIIKGILIALLIVTSVQVYSIQKVKAESSLETAISAISANIRKFSGGMIIAEPSEKVTKEKSTCESGGTCHGTCSNTWKDMTSTNCEKKTFTLKVYSPKDSSTDYCIPSSAKGNGTIASSKLIIDAYTQPTPIVIGTCTCVSAEPECADTTVKTVSIDLAKITLFGTSK